MADHRKCFALLHPGKRINFQRSGGGFKKWQVAGGQGTSGQLVYHNMQYADRTLEKRSGAVNTLPRENYGGGRQQG